MDFSPVGTAEDGSSILEISIFPVIYLRSTEDPDVSKGESDCNHLLAYTSLPIAELALSRADIDGHPLEDGRALASTPS